MSHKSDPSKTNDVSEDSAADTLQTEPSTANAVSVESEAISNEVDAFLMAEKMSPPASMGSMGFGEIPIMPASAPPSSSGMKEHGSADKSDHNDISGMLTIGPPVMVGTKRKASDVALDPMSSGALDPANSKGQEWTNDEDNEVMVQLRNIREGQLTHKNMTVREAEKIQDVLKHRTVNAIKFRWNDKLKKRQNLQTDTQPPIQTWLESSVDPDAFFTASAPSHAGPDRALSPALSSTGAPLSSAGIVAHALVAPGAGGGGHVTSASSDAAATRASAPSHDGLGMDMLNDVLERAIDKDSARHAHMHANAGGEQQAAQQSPAADVAGKPLSLSFYSTADSVRDAMDMLVTSPRSPSEADCRIPASKSGPTSPARSVTGLGKLENGIVLPDGDDGVAALGGRAPSGSGGQDVGADVDRLDALTSEAVDDNCAPLRPASRSSLDPMISALI